MSKSAPILKEASAARKRRTQRYTDDYTKQYPCMTKCSDTSRIYCTVCRSSFSIAHGSKNDIDRHIKTNVHPLHERNATEAKEYRKMSTFVRTVQKEELSENDQDIINAEATFCLFLVEHDVPLSASDHACPLVRKMFPKDKSAKNFLW